MLKVIIADDEIRVCQLISKLIDWNELEMECVAIVHDGISALEAIKKWRPHIVITDIRMPGYDGLELIQRSKEVSDQIKFIIISGYSNFEYTQSAIRYEASDYILKPIKKEELNKTLAQVSAALLQHQADQSQQQQILDEAAQSIESQREKELQFAWNQAQASKHASLDSFMKGEYQRIAVVAIDGYTDAEYVDQLRFALLDALALMDKSCQYHFILTRQGQYIIGWFKMNDLGERRFERDVRQCLLNLMNETFYKHDLRYSIAIGSSIHQDEQLDSSFSSCRYNLYQRWLYPDQFIFNDRYGPQDNYLLQSLLEDNQRSLAMAIESLQEEDLKRTFHTMWQKSQTAEPVSGFAYYQWLKQLSVTIQACFMPVRSDVNEIEQFTAHVLIDIERSLTLKQAYDCLVSYTLNMVKAVMAAKNYAESRPVRQARRIIMVRYENDLTLEEISRELGFSASYFSALFKKETGQKFIDYLIQVRIDASKDLLRNTNLTVAEICRQIGYKDQKHFTSQFKKNTGLKPSEFRKLYA